MGNNEKNKRKHLFLFLLQKVTWVKLGIGVSLECVTEEFGVIVSTIYDLKLRTHF